MKQKILYHVTDAVSACSILSEGKLKWTKSNKWGSVYNSVPGHVYLSSNPSKVVTDNPSVAGKKAKGVFVCVVKVPVSTFPDEDLIESVLTYASGIKDKNRDRDKELMAFRRLIPLAAKDCLRKNGRAIKIGMDRKTLVLLSNVKKPGSVFLSYKNYIRRLDSSYGKIYPKPHGRKGRTKVNCFTES